MLFVCNRSHKDGIIPPPPVHISPLCVCLCTTSCVCICPEWGWGKIWFRCDALPNNSVIDTEVFAIHSGLFFNLLETCARLNITDIDKRFPLLTVLEKWGISKRDFQAWGKKIIEMNEKTTNVINISYLYS